MEFYRFINVKSDAVFKLLFESDIGADFWNISELPDKRVVRTRIVRVILEGVEPGDEIFFGGLLFITDGCCVLKGLILEELFDVSHTATGEQDTEQKTSEESVQSFHYVHLTI